MTSLPLVTRNDDKRKRGAIYKNGNNRTRFKKLYFVKVGERTIALMSAFLFLFLFIGICDAVEYANQWTVEIDGDEAEADEVASLYGFDNMGRLFEDERVFMFRHRSVMKRSLRESTEHNSKLTSHRLVIEAEQQIIKKRVKRDVDFDVSEGPNDPLWPKTWYLQPQTKPSMKVAEAWAAGYTGKGVVVTILDDGIEYTHPDLAANYDKKASSDINGHDDDPIPRVTYNNENRHGTRCAGEVSAVANNGICSVGIAYKSSIGGVRMLDGQVTDMVEGASIGLNQQHIDIYSASWGPDDDGRTVDGPARRAKESFEKGVKLGRNGKGSIFVWASGNGGKKSDNCNCDGYTNSIFTLSISSTTEHTNKPWYSEDCSSTLATTYSSGINSEKQIVTTDLANKCTQSHTGTSASAPLAAGICALALEANSNLTWRDIQHIVVRTANPEGLKADDWKVNAVGRKVSHSFGYGLMDAHAMVLLAKDWKTVPTQRKCNITVLKLPKVSTFSRGNPLKLSFMVNSCEGVMPDRLEHVQAEISANCNKRGGMFIYLTSPSGTRSTLLDQRPLDARTAGFSKWPFMTTHSWDENPKGEWILEISTDGTVGGSGDLTYFNLNLYGTLDNDWPAGLVDNDASTSSKTTSTVSTTNNPVSVLTKNIGPGNCKTPSESNKACLVCQDGFVRSTDMLSCLHQCPVGHFASMEKVKEKVPNTDNKEDNWENQQEVRFEDEERFDGSRICVPCAASPYCTDCSGPEITDCLACMHGFQLVEGQCNVETNTTALHNKIYSLTIVVCILSVVVFVLLFLYLQCCRNGKNYLGSSNSPTYKYVPNGHEEMNEHYQNGFSRTPKLKGSRYKNGRISQDAEESLLDHSEDDRT